MRAIVIEKVNHADGRRPWLVDQIDAVLKEISLELGKLADWEKETSGIDAWVESLREQFWKRQFEMIDDETRFWLRMAVPGFAGAEMHLAISEDSIEVRGEGGTLFHRIPIQERIDPHTVCASFDNGYLQVAGTKLGTHKQIHLVKKTRKQASRIRTAVEGMASQAAKIQQY